MCAALGRLFDRLLSDDDTRALGRGVWRRDHDRFRRAVDRCHQQLEALRDPPGAVPPSVEATGSEAALLLDRVRAVCARAQRIAPSREATVPGGFGGALLDVHRGLSRAGALVAEAAEALAMLRGGLTGPERLAQAASSAVARAGDEVARAAAALDALP